MFAHRFGLLLLIFSMSFAWADEEQSEFFPLLMRPETLPAPILRSETPSPERESRWQETKAQILRDAGSRMTPEFLIPESLKERTSFWFDIYTRYGEAHHVIHHERYPWIIFRVVDTSDILASSKGPRWLHIERSEKMARRQAKEIRAALVRLSKRNSYENLPALEQDLFERLAKLPGPRKSVIRLAALSVRTQLGQRDFFARGLSNSSRYLPAMEEQFRRLGLPTELTRLPFVESSFNENARSKVGASGIWQIMPSTGRAYMTVNENIDERNSPLKATVAASRLLRSYYRAVGSWPLALTSYNNGIGNTLKAIRAAGSRDLSVIISRYHTGDFRFASSNFFSCFLAALYAEKYSSQVFLNLPREPLLEETIVKIKAPIKFRALAAKVGLAHSELLRYNLDLRGAIKANGSIPRGFQLHLPPGARSRFVAGL